MIKMIKKNNNSQIFKNAKGISLVQTLVTAAIVAGVGVGVVQIMESTTRLAKTTSLKLQEDQILFEIQSVLKDTTACENTLGLGSVGGPKNPSADGENVSEIRDHNNMLVFQAGCGPTNLKNCIYGQATKSRILLRSMTIHKYGDASPPWNNAGEKSTLSIELIRGAAIDHWDTLSPSERDTFAKQAYGSPRVIKKLRIKTGLDGSGNIQYCVADDQDILSDSCEFYQGTQSPSDLKCKNVTIETSDTRPAILNLGNYLTEKNSFVLNALQIGPTPPGIIADGNINVEGETYIKKSLYTQTDFIFLNKAALAKESSEDSLLVYGQPNVAQATLNLGNSGQGASITGNANKVGIGTTPGSVPLSELEVNGDTTTQNSLLINKNAYIAQSGSVGGLINWSNDITLTRNGANSLRFDGGSISIASAFNTRSSNVSSYIATQDWVNNQFLTRLGDQAIDAIFNQILDNNSADSRVQTLKRNLCNSIKNAFWNGTRCLLHVNDICAADEFLKGWTNGNKVCVKKFEPTQRCSNVNPPTAVMVGVNSNGTIQCANMQPYVDQGVAVIQSAVNICFAKYPPSGGYVGQNYNPGTKRCTASRNSVQTSTKDGCGALWDKDDPGSCGCWGGWVYDGYNGCSYNWHTTGGICKCRRTTTTNYSCTVSGSWCN